MKNKKFFLTFLAISVLFCLPDSFLFAQDEEEVSPEEVSNGYHVDFEYIRDSIGFQAYSGSLKGSMGTQVEGSGNSLDRAFLLHRLLSAKGFKPQIALGRLRGDNLEKVIALSQGIIPTEEGFDLDVASRERLTTILQDHYWVQLPLPGGKWLDLDPTLPEAVPGKTIAGLRKQLKRVPRHLFQRLEMKVFANFSIGRNKATSQIIRYIGLTKDLMAEPVVLFFLDRGVHGEYRFSASNRFNPVLWAGGIVQPAINLKSEANRQAARMGGKVPPVEIHRIWVEYTLKAPGVRDEYAQRLLYSQESSEHSRLNELTLLSLSTQQLGRFDYSVLTEGLKNNAAILKNIKAPQFPEVLSELEKMNVSRIFFSQKDLAEVLLREVSGQLSGVSRNLENLFTTLPGEISPKLLSVSIDPAVAGMSTDIVLFNSRPAAMEGGELTAMATSFSAGVLASSQEGEILKEIRSITGASHYTDSISQTLTFAQGEAGWIALDVNSFYKLSKYKLDLYLLRRLEGALKGGKYLVLPDYDSFISNGGKALVWWEIDRETGAAVGMISTGIGGSSLQDPVTLDKLAVNYQPAITEGWPAKLAEYSEALANYLSSGFQVESFFVDEKKQAIYTVYQVISRSLNEASFKGMNEALVNFFGKTGDEVMRSHLGISPAETEEVEEPGIEEQQVGHL